MLFDEEWLQTIFPNTDQPIYKNNFIEEVTTNSKTEVKNGLFIPLVGERFDGHEFIEEAIENGSVATLWEQARPLPQNLDERVTVFFVKNTLKALQTLAMVYREKVNPQVVGITGSNGKTSTKDMLASILKTTYRTHFTHGNFNNHIGLPLTILSMPIDTEVLVLEMGMNHFGEIGLLSDIARPNHAIVTNIGESHIENLGSRIGIAQEKLDIVFGLENNGSLIVDGDEELLTTVKAQKGRMVTCGFTSNVDKLIHEVHISNEGTTFKLENERYSIPLYGKHHAKNSSFAIVMAKLLKVNNKNIQKGLSKTKVTDMRFEWITGPQQVTIINDAYNASPTSMVGAIEVIKELENYKRKILVLGDVFELGKHAEAMHKSIAKSITEPIDYLFTFGELAKHITTQLIEDKATLTAKHFESMDSLIETISEYLDEETIILFKASRGMAFEKLVNAIK